MHTPDELQAVGSIAAVLVAVISVIVTVLIYRHSSRTAKELEQARKTFATEAELQRKEFERQLHAERQSFEERLEARSQAHAESLTIQQNRLAELGELRRRFANSTQQLKSALGQLFHAYEALVRYSKQRDVEKILKGMGPALEARDAFVAARNACGLEFKPAHIKASNRLLTFCEAVLLDVSRDKETLESEAHSRKMERHSQVLQAWQRRSSWIIRAAAGEIGPMKKLVRSRVRNPRSAPDPNASAER